jgi:hypothetical protein
MTGAMTIPEIAETFNAVVVDVHIPRESAQTKADAMSLLTSGLRLMRGEGASRKWKGAVEIRQQGR